LEVSSSTRLLFCRHQGILLTRYSLPQIPTYLVIFASPKPVVAILVPIAIIAAVIGGLEAVVFGAVRMVFAWSFDRIVPTKFSEIGIRTRSPNYALALVGLVGLVYVLIYVFAANILTLYAYATSGIYLAISIVGIVAVVFPSDGMSCSTRRLPRRTKR